MKLNKFVKLIVPPFLLMYAKDLGLFPGTWWIHGYPSWESALASSSGYDDMKILEKVSSATRKVVLGEVACERDSVTFDTIEYSWPVLAGLMRAAAMSDGALNLLDFGGSLGSSYYQNKAFLTGLKKVSWHVVEQPHYVQRGKELFQKGDLKFNLTIEEALGENPAINIVLLSSVLQYFSDPYALLEKIFQFDIDHILVDRSSFTAGDVDKITVQKVPPHIYKASYPCHFFSLASFVDLFMDNGYKIVELFNANDGILDKNHFWKGMIFEKIRE